MKKPTSKRAAAEANQFTPAGRTIQKHPGKLSPRNEKIAVAVYCPKTRPREKKARTLDAGGATPNGIIPNSLKKSGVSAMPHRRYDLEQKIPLRHWPHVHCSTREQLAISPDAVGVPINADFRRGVVAIVVALAELLPALGPLRANRPRRIQWLHRHDNYAR